MTNFEERKNTMRKLASIQRVVDIQPIEGADNIQVATVNAWKLVVKKGEYNVGDLAIYCEIDSFLPVRDEFEFLRKSSFKMMGDIEGFRLRTIKLRGQVSQGLLLPVELLKSYMGAIEYSVIEEGDDVTDIIGVIKYESPIPAQLAGKMKGNFPSFIPKTDEERIQNLSRAYSDFRLGLYYVTEKLDGSSITIYLKDGVFGVCSRNIDLLETEENSYWSVARQLDLETKLKGYCGDVNIALQGELVGEGIQGNPYKLKVHSIFFFNAFNIDTQSYFSFNDFNNLIYSLDLKTVPVLTTEFTLPETIADLLAFAEGKSVLHENTEREGLVIRSMGRSVSFKAISNKFLLKEK